MMHPRIARRQWARAEDCSRLLLLVKRLKSDLGDPIDDVERLLVRALDTCESLRKDAELPAEPRHRVKITPRDQHSPPRKRFYIYLDECGNHAPVDQSGMFPVFCLTAIIIDAEDIERADRIFRTWKAQNLGSPHEVLHEPELRKGTKVFKAHSFPQRQEIAHSLVETVKQIPLTCIAAVLDKHRLEELFSDGKVDEFLPNSTYLLCVDLLFERILHFLYHAGGDALGIVVAESRGLREDVEVQAEFLRLQLEGTQFIKESHFRNQLRSYILFRQKKENDTGLQLADSFARPIAEKAIGHKPGIISDAILSGKIYDGLQGRPHSYGIKIFPTPDISHPWDPLLKAKEER